MDLELIDETKEVKPEDLELVRKILNFAGDYLKLPKDTEMSVTFMNDEAIHVINRDYRNTDRSTDVISFAIEEDSVDEVPIIFGDDIEAEDIPRNIGDIMISTETTKRQAEEYGHSFERELGFLAVHGFLHLNGYDHMKPEDEKVMFALQREIMDAYGLKR